MEPTAISHKCLTDGCNVATRSPYCRKCTGELEAKREWKTLEPKTPDPAIFLCVSPYCYNPLPKGEKRGMCPDCREHSPVTPFERHSIAQDAALGDISRQLEKLTVAVERIANVLYGEEGSDITFVLGSIDGSLGRVARHLEAGNTEE